MQIVSLQFSWNVKVYFLGKIRNYFKLSSAAIVTQNAERDGQQFCIGTHDGKLYDYN